METAMILRTTLALAVAATLSACVVENNQMPAQSRPAPALAPQAPPPDVGFSRKVSNAAVEACRRALDAQTDGAIEVTGTDFMENRSIVYMVVGANRAPWQCLGNNDGRSAELMFLGRDGG
jgi:hypothetical protein